MPVAGRDLQAGRLVTVIDGVLTYPVSGDERPMWVTVSPAKEGGPVAMTTYGTCSHDDWSFDPGAPVFMGTTGKLIKTPNDSPVGVAVSETEVNLDAVQ
ncbi:MAG: hypothetical protein JWM31_1264 [Solirubrobacterales bacterium]|nr:hypothetical protein [Solirubrobacterales bacterium]